MMLQQMMTLAQPKWLERHNYQPLSLSSTLTSCKDIPLTIGTRIAHICTFHSRGGRKGDRSVIEKQRRRHRPITAFDYIMEFNSEEEGGALIHIYDATLQRGGGCQWECIGEFLVCRVSIPLDQN